MESTCTRGADECPEDPEFFSPGCCPPALTATLESRCRGTLDVCCLHPNRSHPTSHIRMNIHVRTFFRCFHIL